MGPQLRQDLTFEKEEQQGGVFYRVVDPKSSSSFTLYEIEYQIASKFNGLNSVADLVELVKRELNFDISVNDLCKFVEQLDQMGYLEKWDDESPTEPFPRKAEFLNQEPQPASDSDQRTAPTEGTTEAITEGTTEAITEGTTETITASQPTENTDPGGEGYSDLELPEEVDRLISEETDEILSGDPPALADPPSLPSSPELELPNLAAEGDKESDETLEAEEHRLIESALIHIKQGYIKHAKDYVLAALKLSPDNNKLTEIVGHFDIVGDDSGSAEVEFLWRQIKNHYPELCDNINPPGTGILPLEVGIGREPNGVFTTKKRSKWLIVVGILAALLLLSGATYFGFQLLKSTPLSVSLTTAQPTTAFQFYRATAQSLKPKQTTWLQFKRGGPVEAVLVKKGETVKADDLLARLRMPPKMRSQRENMEKRLEQFKNKHERAALELERLRLDLTNSEDALKTVEDRLKELKKAAEEGTGVSKRDRKKWEQKRRETKRTVIKLKKSIKKPRRVEKKALAKVQQIANNLKRMEKKNKAYLTAPFAGRVTSINISADQPVKPSTKVIELGDESEIIVVFKMKSEPTDLKKGKTVKLALGDAPPITAKVQNIKKLAKQYKVEILVRDPEELAENKLSDLRLVKQELKDAKEIPQNALIKSADQTRVLIIKEGKVAFHKVSVIEERSKGLVAILAKLQPSDQIVLNAEEKPLKEIKEGAEVKVPNKGAAQ